MKVLPLPYFFGDIYFKKNLTKTPFSLSRGCLMNLQKDHYVYSYEEFSNHTLAKINMDGAVHYYMVDSNLDEESTLLDEEFQLTEMYGDKKSKLFSADYLHGRFIKKRSTEGWYAQYFLELYEDINSKPIKEIEFSYSSAIRYEDSLVVVSTVPKIISRVDHGLDFKWQREFPHDHIHGCVNEELLDYKDTVITNLASPTATKKKTAKS